MAYKTLNSLPLGQSAKVVEILSDGREYSRLRDLGLIGGTKIRPLFKSMFGDPVAYGFRGIVVALRNEDAVKIIVDA